jgi:phosphoribosylanthranilate isomerase
MTSQDDVLYAAQLGVDAIGLIFHPNSPRYVTAGQAASLIENLPPFVSKVGVFVNESLETINAILRVVTLDILQFHGQESADFCRAFKKPYIKVIPVADQPISTEFTHIYPDAQGFLFDTYKENVPGGSGVTFNWRCIPHNLEKPIILAGGLTVDNVRQALLETNPYAVDVTSGIEATKGIKDKGKMARFMAAIMDYSKEA